MARTSEDSPRQTQYPPAREEKGSGAGMAVLLVIVGLVFIAGPFILGSYVKVPLVSQMIISAFGVVLLVVGGIMFTVTQLYEKATMNEAFVRTGVGGPKVVQDGAAIVIPAIHRITRVSLETIRLEIARLAEQSFITGDSLHVDVRAQFYIRVNREPAAIMAAATSLGNKSGVDELIMGLVGDKLISGLRTVAGRKDLDYLHAHVDAYSEEVKKIVETDLEHNGLFLESVTVTYLNQTPLSNLKPEENIFDAQGARKIAAVTNAQRVEISKIKTGADQEVKQQEVTRDQELFRLSIQRETSEAETNLTISNAKAEAARKGAEVVAQQGAQSKIAEVKAAQDVEVAGVEKQRAVQIATADQQKVVQAAQIAKDQAIQTATIAKDQSVQVADVDKQRTIEIAQREQQIAIANKETERAAAEAKRIAAETERTRAEQDKLTVEKTAAAEREKNIAVIAKESSAKQVQIEQNMQADVAAYTTIKQAEAGNKAAAEDAAAARTTAQGRKDALELEAQGDQAKALVPVNVSREQVVVEQSRVTVLKSELEAKTANEKMSFELQIELAKIEADKQVRIEQAKAQGAALASSNMTIFGDPTTFARMMAAFNNGQTSGKYIEGVLAQTPEPVKDLAFSTIESFSSLLSAAASRLFGKDISADMIATEVKAEMDRRTAAGGAKSTTA